MFHGVEQLSLPVTNSRATVAGLLAATAYRWRRRIATGMVALLAVVLGYYVVDGHNGLSVYRQKRIENRDLAQQIEQLNQENARLKDHVDRLNNDPDAIEHEAREKLHYSRPGEVIYTLNDASPSGAKSAEPATPSPKPR